MDRKTKFLTHAATIAALYFVLTLIANAAGLASGVIQVRLSEVLTIMPVFTPAAIPGLFVGCLISNALTGCLPWDIVFGSIATLIGAIGTRLLRNKHPLLYPVPPILANCIIVPFILQYVYQFEGSYFYFMLTVGIGEVIACGVLGLLLYKALNRPSVKRYIEIH